MAKISAKENIQRKPILKHKEKINYDFGLSNNATSNLFLRLAPVDLKIPTNTDVLL